MNTYSPSYLHKNRYGIFHFRCRIPISIRKKYDLKKVEIRKSLGTGNRAEALRLSRIMWVKLEQSEYMMEDWEADKAKFDKLLAEGRELHKELQAVESDPNHIPSDTEDFFDWLSPRQKVALAGFQQYLKAQEKKQAVQQPEPPHESKPFKA